VNEPVHQFRRHLFSSHRVCDLDNPLTLISPTNISLWSAAHLAGSYLNLIHLETTTHSRPLAGLLQIQDLRDARTSFNTVLALALPLPGFCLRYPQPLQIPRDCRLLIPLHRCLQLASLWLYCRRLQQRRGMLAELHYTVGTDDGPDKYRMQGNESLSQYLDRDVFYREGGFDIMSECGYINNVGSPKCWRRPNT